MFLHSPGSIGVGERTEQVNEYLIDPIRNCQEDEFSVLDLGCGIATYERNLLDDNPNLGASFTCVDNDTRAVEILSSIVRKNGHRDKIDVENYDVFDYLDYNSDVFDLAVSVGIIDWLEKNECINFLSRVRKSLGSNGIIVTSVVDSYRFMSLTDKILGMGNRVPKDYNDLIEMLKEAGYKNI